MKPRLHHRICARPLAICWVIGTLILWIPITGDLWRDDVLPAAFTDLSSIFCLLIFYACLSGMGFYVGAIAFYWWAGRACRWMNGGPYVVGDRVTILTGPQAGITTTVYALTRGQGGYLQPRVELGAEAREKYLDIRDDFTLLRTPVLTDIE